jgi:hypothetical protein
MAEMKWDDKALLKAMDDFGKRSLLKDALEGAGAGGDEEFANASKKAKSLRSLYKLYGPELGIPHAGEMAETGSLSELEGGLKGMILQQDAEERRQKKEYQSALVKQMRSGLDDKKRQQAANSEFSRLASEPAARERWGEALAGGPTMAGASQRVGCW